MRDLSNYRIAAAALWLAIFSAPSTAQDLEPRAYSNAPVGLNFLAVAYQHSEGALIFDPAVPITDAKSELDIGIIGYVRTMGVAGRSAKLGIVLPYADMAADGYLNGDYRTRDASGIADPSLAFTINLMGAPALTPAEFAQQPSSTVIGLTVRVNAPWGDYQKEKLINLGTNRWTVKSELGAARPIGRWTLEVAGAVTYYTDNDEFNIDQTRHQDLLYSLQGHAIYSFPRGIWAALGVNYYTGGRTTIDGVLKNDLQQNWRTGFSLAIPIDRNHSLKLFGSSGVSTRTGTDFDSLGIAWQYRWGGGL